MDKLTLMAMAAAHPLRATEWTGTTTGVPFYECARCAALYIDSPAKPTDVQEVLQQTVWSNYEGECRTCRQSMTHEPLP